MIVIKNFKCPSLNKNYAGQHWSKRAGEARKIQWIIRSAVMTQKIKPVKKYPVDIKIIAYYKGKRKHDSPNVSDKEIIDGLVLAKVLKDDSTKYVRWAATKAVTGADENKVEIRIR